MTVTAEEVMATYEDLAKLEAQFDDVETETIRYQYKITKPLYAKRAEVVAKISSFWSLVFEQAPMEIDEFIQPTDSALLLGSIHNFSVERFEIESDVDNGEPRSVLFRFEFNENEYFEDKVIEKKFWWRYGKDGTIGYVSEPVNIKWKEGKDLTNGLLALARAAWEEDQAVPKKDGKDKKEKALGPAASALKKKMEEHEGAVSFFAWFGFVGEKISAEENAEVVAKKKAGEEIEAEDTEMQDGDDEDWEDEDDLEDLEIFPNGDEVAMALADDLWSNALKYFTAAQDDDLDSDAEFESGDEDEEDEEDEEEGSSAQKPSKKKHKGCAHGCKH